MVVAFGKMDYSLAWGHGRDLPSFMVNYKKFYFVKVLPYRLFGFLYVCRYTVSPHPWVLAQADRPH